VPRALPSDAAAPLNRAARHRLPFYYFLKLIALVVLFHETTRVRGNALTRACARVCASVLLTPTVWRVQGAEWVYNNLVRRVLVSQQTTIDRGLARVAEEVQTAGERAKDATARAVASVVAEKAHGQ
jgi:hypothetical protein